VELWGRDEGFEGSWYRAEVVQLESKLEEGKLSTKRVRVAIDELLEEGSPEDWVYTPPEAVWDGAEWREIGSGMEVGSPEGAGAGADAPASEKAVPKAARRAGGKAAGTVVDHRLREWWPLKRLRPLPPPPPAGFGSMLHVSGTDEAALDALAASHAHRAGYRWTKSRPGLEDVFIHLMAPYRAETTG
jgi:hypothetical protein